MTILSCVNLYFSKKWSSPITIDFSKKGFTLAEVLITLGIIGIVAALTLPTLISNYKKKVYVENFKIGFSVLQEAMRKSMADDGVTNFDDTFLVQYCNSDVFNENCKKELLKLFKVTSFVPVDSTYKDCSKVGTKYGYAKYINNDGCENSAHDFDTIMLLENGMSMAVTIRESRGGLVMLDTNGLKNPNTYGRDIFELRILNTTGEVMAVNSYRSIVYDYKRFNHRIPTFEENRAVQLEDCDPKGEDAFGLTCSGLIVDEGWQMNY